MLKKKNFKSKNRKPRKIIVLKFVGQKERKRKKKKD
jgi:hypothetical protein